LFLSVLKKIRKDRIKIFEWRWIIGVNQIINKRIT